MLASSSPPHGFLAFLLKIPRWLYRLRLGWLLGHRFLLLTHRGRRSGRPYATVLEVVRYDPARDESIVVSGWGDRSDWYQNLEASPALAIETGGKRYRPAQRFLPTDEVYQAMRGYLRRNRWASGIVKGLFGLEFDGSEGDRHRAQNLRGVAFRPAHSSAHTPAPTAVGLGEERFGVRALAGVKTLQESTPTRKQSPEFRENHPKKTAPISQYFPMWRILPPSNCL